MPRKPPSTVPTPGVPERSESGASWRADVTGIFHEIDALEDRVQTLDLAYGGLKDIDDVFRLILLKLSVAHVLITHPDSEDSDLRLETARKQATDALVLTDLLQAENLSLDQREIISDSDEMRRIRSSFDLLARSGGDFLFIAQKQKKRQTRAVSNAMKKALLKYCRPQHSGNYSGDVPPSGIPEGSETVVSSENMTIPLSQAVLLIEEELIPQIDEKLENSPGNPALIRQKSRLQEQAAMYRRARFFPRARPVILDERGLFTRAISSFSADGELLVTVSLPTYQNSGNTFDLLLEQIKVEVVRDCIGRGVSPELDETIRHHKSIQSGRRGSMTEIDQKLDIQSIFRTISLRYPFLRRLESRNQLKHLAHLAHQGDTKELTRSITAMAREDHNLLSAAIDL